VKGKVEVYWEMRNLGRSGELSILTRDGPVFTVPNVTIADFTDFVDDAVKTLDQAKRFMDAFSDKWVIREEAEA